MDNSQPAKVQWQITAVHTDGVAERLPYPTYEKTTIVDWYEDKETVLDKLLANSDVASIEVATRLVTEWKVQDKLVKQWVAKSV